MNTNRKVSSEPKSEHVEHTLHYAHVAHVTAEMGEKALTRLESAARFVKEINAAQKMVKTHAQIARDIARMQFYVWRLTDASNLGGSVKDLLTPRLLRAKPALWQMKNVFQAEREPARVASRLLSETSVLRSSARGTVALRLGQVAENFERVLRTSAIGSRLLSTGRILTSKPVTLGLIVISSALEAYRSYRHSSAQTTGGRLANAVLGGGAGYLTSANPWMAAADLLPEGYRSSEFLRGTMDSAAMFGEGLITGDTRPMEEVHQRSMKSEYGVPMQTISGLGGFVADLTPAIRAQFLFEDARPLDDVHKRSMQGAYGKVLQAASEAGEFWADRGVSGGMREFMESIKWWVSH